MLLHPASFRIVLLEAPCWTLGRCVVGDSCRHRPNMLYALAPGPAAGKGRLADQRRCNAPGREPSRGRLRTVQCWSRAQRQQASGHILRGRQNGRGSSPTAAASQDSIVMVSCMLCPLLQAAVAVPPPQPPPPAPQVPLHWALAAGATAAVAALAATWSLRSGKRRPGTASRAPPPAETLPAAAAAAAAEAVLAPPADAAAAAAPGKAAAAAAAARGTPTAAAADSSTTAPDAAAPPAQHRADVADEVADEVAAMSLEELQSIATQLYMLIQQVGAAPAGSSGWGWLVEATQECVAWNQGRTRQRAAVFPVVRCCFCLQASCRQPCTHF